MAIRKRGRSYQIDYIDPNRKRVRKSYKRRKNATFPGGTPESIVAHLKKEVDELAESNHPEEAADCLILLLHHAHRCGYDLMTWAFWKFEINKKRTWGQSDENGVIEHIRERERKQHDKV